MLDFDCVFSILTNDKWPDDHATEKNLQKRAFSSENIREPQCQCGIFVMSIWEKKFARPREKIYGPTGEADFSHRNETKEN